MGLSFKNKNKTNRIGNSSQLLACRFENRYTHTHKCVYICLCIVYMKLARGVVGWQLVTPTAIQKASQKTSPIFFAKKAFGPLTNFGNNLFQYP